MRIKRLLYLYPFCIMSLISACSYPEADYYESRGIVSIHAGNAPAQTNWAPGSHESSSKAMVSAGDSRQSGNTLSFTFYLQQPGEYSLWVMSARQNQDTEQNFLPFRVENEDGFLLDDFRLKLPSSPLLEWVNSEHATGDRVSIFFEEAGYYTLIFDSGGKPGYVVDRIHLSLNDEPEPQGMGYPETIRPGADPVLAKRDEPVMLPPAWAFGIIYGGTKQAGQTLEQIWELDRRNFSVDAFWIDAPPEIAGIVADSVAGLPGGENIRWGVTLPAGRNFSESGITPDFIKLEGDAGLDKIRSAYQFTQMAYEQAGRGFLLADLFGLNDPEFKQYPVRRMETRYEWSHTETSAAGLKEAIERVSNPRLAVYEVPFLTHTLAGSAGEEDEMNEELYIRWNQFAAFNPIMNVFSPADDLPPGMPYSYTEAAMYQFQFLANLRSRLFPYIYSLGHRLRATGDKPITGDGVRTDQYFFGDALLVAPVYAEGESERQVYFPEGLWYDFWNGRTYEGGQSWIAEAGLAKIPVFVKAGSIIPYRDGNETSAEPAYPELRLDVYTGGVGTFRLYEDDGYSLAYREGEFATTAFRYFEQTDYSTFTIGAVAGSFEGQVTEKEFSIYFKNAREPVEMEANGHVLEKGSGIGQWIYNPDKREVILNWVQPDHQKTDFTIRWE